MKKSDLTAKTVAELKSPGQEEKGVLSAGSKKDDIIKTLIAVAKS